MSVQNQLLPTGFAEYWQPQFPGDDLARIASVMRDEETVMVPAEMAAVRSAATSFADSLIARATSMRWHVTRLGSTIDADAVGELSYLIWAEGSEFTFSLRSQPPGDEMARQGRLRENEFDLYGILTEGRVSTQWLASEHDEQITKAWKGRAAAGTLGWSFANRSHRLFAAVVDALASGDPDCGELLSRSGGYLVRNAGFYGNGRHGTKAWLSLGAEHPLAHPYHLDLLTLLMWKIASIDLVELAALHRNPDAPALPAEVRSAVGVGNSSGIGTVATQVKWPTTLAAITFAREFSIARAIHCLGTGEKLQDFIREFPCLADRNTDPSQDQVVTELGELLRQLSPEERARVHRELINRYPETVSSLEGFIGSMMQVNPTVEPSMSLRELSGLVRDSYLWVDQLAQRGDTDRKYFWYRSAENGENRRGERELDPGVDFETFIDVAGAIRDLTAAMRPHSADETVGRFLLQHPEFALVVGRIQLTTRMPYSEIRSNLVSGDFRPSELIHYFLTCLGMNETTPVSDLWVRGVFFAGVPVDGFLDGLLFGYPELRRMLPDAIRSFGTPLALAVETAEMLVWSQACMDTTLDAWFESRPHLDLQVHPLIKGEVIDLRGQSLFDWGARVADAVCADAGSTGGDVFEVAGFSSGLQVLPYVLDRIARTTGTAAELQRLSVGAEHWTSEIRSQVGEVGVRTRATGSFLCSNLEPTPMASRWRICLGASLSAGGLRETSDPRDLTELRETAFFSGLLVPQSIQKKIAARTAQLRIAPSERSSAQAG